jgi:hypothetical protein
MEKKDFTHIDLDKDQHYYSFKTDKIEICIEPCAGGFCVVPYSLSSDPLDQDMLEPRKCTNCDGFLSSLAAMSGERNDKVWEKALGLANDIQKRLGGIHNGTTESK